MFLPPPAVLRQLVPTPPPGARPGRSRRRRHRRRPGAAPGQGPDQRRPAVRPADEGPDDPEARGRPHQGRRRASRTCRAARRATPLPRPRRPPRPPRWPRRAGARRRCRGARGSACLPASAASCPAETRGAGRGRGRSGPQIAGAVEGLSRRLERDARWGCPPGTGQNIGGLYFDPQGADFTLWINTFKNEVYRNWIVPQAAQFGSAGATSTSSSPSRGTDRCRRCGC